MTACNRSAYFYSLLPYIFSRSPHLILIKKKKVKPFSLSPYFFPLYYSGKDMARQTRSSSGDSAPSFIHQNILQDPEKEICTFDSAHLSALKTSGIFPKGTVFRPFDREIRSDMVSDEWICFNAFPFTLGLQFPFPDFITEFFDTTKICFSQTMPMLWRVLLVLDQIKNNHIPDLSIHDLPLSISA